MEVTEMNRKPVYRVAFFAMVLNVIASVAFVAGLFYSMNTHAAEGSESGKRVVYPKKTDLDFEGAQIEGEIRNPGEFYFQRKPEEKFDSLVKRRKNFHRELLRDVVVGK